MSKQEKKVVKKVTVTKVDNDIGKIVNTNVDNVYKVKLEGFKPYQEVCKTGSWDGCFRVPDLKSNKSISVQLVLSVRANENGMALLLVKPVGLPPQAEKAINEAIKNGELF